MAEPASPRILVTGATGFVGRHLVAALAAAGSEVHILTRGTATVDGASATHRIPADTEDLVALFARIEPSAVVHLAALFRGVHATADVVPLVRANVEFTAQVAEATAASGVSSLVYAGTAWQHFEGAGYAPAALYAATKQAGQDVLRYYAEVGALSVVALKMFDTYGADDSRGKLLQLLTEMGPETELPLSPGDQLIDLLHIDDVVSAFMRALELARELPGWHEFSLSTGRAVTIRELVKLVGDLRGQPLRVEFGARNYRAREMFEPWYAGEPLPGWVPRISLEDGVRSLLKKNS
jgi:nucleoside-diphosphate-sugar epimerase